LIAVEHIIKDLSSKGPSIATVVALVAIVERLDEIARVLQAGNVVQAIAHDVDARHAG
jgi:hypothetical protein